MKQKHYYSQNGNPYRIPATDNIQELKEQYEAQIDEYEDDIANLHMTINALESKRSFTKTISETVRYVVDNFMGCCLFLLFCFFALSIVSGVILCIKSAFFPGKPQYCYITNVDSRDFAKKYTLKVHYDYAIDGNVSDSTSKEELKAIAKEFNCELKMN